MKQKGQVAIEFIFILLIIIVYIFTVTKPLIESGQGAASDIEKISRIKSETSRIATNINQTYLLGNGTKKTFNIFIPTNTTLKCYTNTIGFEANINKNNVNPPVGICTNNTCDYNSEVLEGVSINCEQPAFGSGTYPLVVEKVNDVINLRVG